MDGIAFKDAMAIEAVDQKLRKSRVGSHFDALDAADQLPSVGRDTLLTFCCLLLVEWGGRARRRRGVLVGLPCEGEVELDAGLVFALGLGEDAVPATVLTEVGRGLVEKSGFCLGVGFSF